MERRYRENACVGAAPLFIANPGGPMGTARRGRRAAGDSYKSQFERDTARYLTQKGIEFTYESKTYELSMPVIQHTCTDCNSKKIVRKTRYTPDFFLANGTVLEVKGRWPSLERKRITAFKEQYPEVDIRMVFMYDNWLTGAKKQRYSEWCEARGIQWTIGCRIPDEWTKV